MSAIGEVLPDPPGSGERQITSCPAIGETVAGSAFVARSGSPAQGTYQHCGQQHLHRYLAWFDFGYSNRKALGVDNDLRTEQIVQGVVGTRSRHKQLVMPTGKREHRYGRMRKITSGA